MVCTRRLLGCGLYRQTQPGDRSLHCAPRAESFAVRFPVLGVTLHLTVTERCTFLRHIRSRRQITLSSRKIANFVSAEARQSIPLRLGGGEKDI
jgi:hypothetical protein